MAEKINIKDTFKTKVKERLALHPNNWAGEDSANVTLAMIAALKDDTGNPVTLDGADKDIVTLASRPTQELQARVITTILERHRVKVDSETADLIKRVVSPTAFKMELTKAGVIKDDSKGLNDLLS